MKNLTTTLVILCCLIHFTTFGQISTLGLQAYYPFNGNAQDISGNGLHGVVNGASLAIDRYGIANKAYSFDGIDDFIGLNHSFTGYTELTISAWFKITASAPNLQAIISSDNSGKFVHMQTNTNSAHDNAIYYTNATVSLGAMLLTQPIANLNSWTHMVMTVKSGNTNLYLDGVHIDQETNLYTTLTSTNLLRIGSGHLNGRFFNGSIDDIRIYNRALTFEEVADLYQAENPPLNYVFMNVTCMHQGYYNGFYSMEYVLYNQNVEASPSSHCDSVRIELYATNPIRRVYSTKRMMLTNGTIAVGYPTRLLLTNHYITVKHRNAIETWSNTPITLYSSISYNFSNSPNNAFGLNMQEVEPGVWAIYTGDINQDKNIDLLDAAILENAVLSFASGHQVSDLTGDGNVDLIDAALLEQNVLAFLFVNEP